MYEPSPCQKGHPVQRRVRQTGRTGFTIVELLVVIAIIGVLVALLLPAVFAAREAARRVQCQNHLKQIATAILLHEEAHGHFPTGGWGNQWVGDPDRGFSIEQPGGWMFNILPYLEAGQIRNLGRRKFSETKTQAIAEMLTTPISVLNCPSRRGPRLEIYDGPRPLRNAELPALAAKNDYAICGGDVPLRGDGGPVDASPEALREYKWPSHEQFSGIAFVLSEIRVSQVSDGSTHVYLAGEKLLHGPSEQNWGDDQTLYVGDDADVRRWTAEPPRRDGSDGVDYQWFGSAHASGCYFVLCDGSVQHVNYDIDPEMHRRLGNRHDGLVVDPDAQGR
jgi:prepilin-type N-terminal cleavage/methylation domain-containing protein